MHTISALELAIADLESKAPAPHNCRPPGCPGAHEEGSRPCRRDPFSCEVCNRRWVVSGVGWIPAKNAPRPNGRVSPPGTRPQNKKKGKRR